MSVVVAAVGVGLTATSMIGGARRNSKQSRLQKASARRQLGSINQALGELDTLAGQKSDIANSDFQSSLVSEAKTIGRTKSKMIEKGEDAMTSFAFSGEAEETLSQATEEMDFTFDESKRQKEVELDKTLSAIDEWKGGEASRLNAEKDVLNEQIKVASTTDSFWENIFG
tara:strand:- start:5702 stop:6211 length:510 start_codon:yes stop_codon:yes gene_type:complete